MRISEFLSQDHRHCDARFAELEGLLLRADWNGAGAALEAFAEATLHHFAMEEAVLFPALEQATGQPQGPTRVMRMEHADMRQLLDELREAMATRDREACAGVTDTLLIMLQQHNTKEEQVLYPLADRLFGDSADDLLERLKAAA
jgi:hemerythrin-like domain-containing protein